MRTGCFFIWQDYKSAVIEKMNKKKGIYRKCAKITKIKIEFVE